MNSVLWRFLDALGLDEEPMGIVYTSDKPASGLHPKYQTPVTRSAEEQGKVDWAEVDESFSCEESFVNTEYWSSAMKKISESKKVWGEETNSKRSVK